MPVQMQASDFLNEFGPDLVRINAEAAAKPVTVGFPRLPGGIKNGIAKLTAAQLLVQDREDGQVPNGKGYFQAQAVCVYPVIHNGQRIQNVPLKAKFIPMCDTPAKGYFKATRKEDNYLEFQNFLRAMGVPVCLETDPTRIYIHWVAGMRSLTDPQRPQGPVYFKFSTNSFTPPKPVGWREGDPMPEEKTKEEWLALATPDEVRAHLSFNPATAVNVNGAQPHHSDTPPSMGADGLPLARPGEATPEPEEEEEMEDIQAKVNKLVHLAEQEDQTAREELEQMAWSNGWTEEQTDDSETWNDLGIMALNEPQEDQGKKIEVGGRWMFARRSKTGERLKNEKGNPFPAVEVEVTWTEGDICHLKTVKDGKDVTDARSKKPLDVKHEWLE